MWVTSYEGDTNPTDIQTNPDESVTGDKAFHFYSESDFNFSVEQTVEGLSEGTYTLSTKMQGEGVGADAEIYLYALVDGQEYTSEKIVLDVLGNWKHTEITEIMIPEGGSIQVGMRVKGQANGMGTIDDWELNKEV